MPLYPLSPVTSGNTIYASDVNQLVSILQKASGSQETGKWFLAGNAYATDAAFSLYMPLLSRYATPVSVSVDTSDQTPVNMSSTIHTNHLSSGGFQIWATSTGVTANAYGGGNWTVNF